MKYMIELRGCKKQYGSKEVFSGISLNLSNQIYWICGPNGAGKSVFARCMVGVEDFSEGKVMGLGKRILYLPDTALGEPWLTMEENIELMYWYYGVSLEQTEKMEILHSLQIADLEELYAKVSVGTAMKVGLSLVFLKNRFDVIVLDETLSHLDMKMKQTVMEELKKRCVEGTTVLLVHHNEGEWKVGDKIKTLKIENHRMWEE